MPGFKSSRGGYGRDRGMSYKKRNDGDRFGGDRSERREDRRGERRGGLERRGPLVMHDVTCAKCGKLTQVPFKPSGSKPVYCSDCFRKTGDSGFSDSRREPSGSGQLDIINKKLDKIMEALEIK
ncbi:MAG: hypothetical protein EPN86_01045 [Nanoarchaeota archaeon]|nr:MAG: hypothetical protein EPN86_01045 [Nanoarchaeota archaeon]